MDEIDNIIIHSLRQIGCEIDDELTLSQFSPNLLVSYVSRCLKLIDPSLDLPKSLPSAMAQKYGATTALAEACLKVGYRGEIGYQTFLYSNITETRRIFMFLIENLPKEEPDAVLSEGPITKRALLEKEMRKNLMESLKSPFQRQIINFIEPKELPFEAVELNIPLDEQGTISSKNCPSIFHQTNPNNLFPSIIVKNDKQSLDYQETLKLATKRTRRQQKVGDSAKEETEEDVEDIEEEKIDPIEEAQTRIENLKMEINQKMENCNFLKEKITEQQEILSNEDEKLDKLKTAKRVKERTLVVLENPEENIQKLEQMIKNSHDKMKKLNDQWDEHRMPLMEAMEKIEERNSKKLSKSKLIEDQITETRVKQDVIRDEMKDNYSIYHQLSSELEGLNQNITRSAYTSRILEIIGNIRKQKMDIDKVLCDTRELQKEINTITGQLDRQFTVTDDLLFKTAKRDDYSRKAYKLLATLHADCAELVKSIQESGAIIRETRDLEEQIENEKMKNVSATLQQISADLEQMQKDNQQRFETN